MHTHTHTHKHKHAQQAGCGSVTHFELYRTKSFVFFFTEQTHNKTRDEEHNKQQEQQLKAALEDAKMHALKVSRSTRLGTIGRWLCMEHVDDVAKRSVSRVDELTLKSQVGGRRR